MPRLLGIVGEPLTGVSYVRFVQPFRHLLPLGFELVTLGEQLTLERGPEGYRPAESLYEGVDGVLFPQMVASPELADGSRLDLVERVCEFATRHGLKIIYSVDDDISEIEAVNPGYERIQESIENLETILEYADAIFVTTPALEGTLASQGKPIHLLPNAVEPDRWKPRPRSSGEMRVGWAGSSSHLEDLLMVLPAIRKLADRVPFRFVVQGLIDRPIAEEAKEVRRLRPGLTGSQRATADLFLELAAQLDEIDHRHVPFTGMESYFGVLSDLDLDIGICPLLDTDFNRHKSALKFYEYAMCDTMTVASAVTPYEEEVSVTADNDPDAWCEALEAHLRDADRREAELERQRAFVLAERNIQSLKYRWAGALDATLDTQQPATSGAGRLSR